MKSCEIRVTGGTLPDAEIEAYKARAMQQYGSMPDAIDIEVDGDYVGLKYHFHGHKFDRIRRITGYLTGTLDSWNDAKRAEEHDRVKHGAGANV